MSVVPVRGGPYHDLRVLDASTGAAGAMAAMFLADYGADVVKIEPVRAGPLDDDPGWLCWDRNKILTSFDPAGRHGRRELRRLLAATLRATSGLAPSASNSRYMVVPRFQCLSWMARSR